MLPAAVARTLGLRRLVTTRPAPGKAWAKRRMASAHPARRIADTSSRPSRIGIVPAISASGSWSRTFHVRAIRSASQSCSDSASIHEARLTNTGTRADGSAVARSSSDPEQRRRRGRLACARPAHEHEPPVSVVIHPRQLLLSPSCRSGADAEQLGDARFCVSRRGKHLRAHPPLGAAQSLHEWPAHHLEVAWWPSEHAPRIRERAGARRPRREPRTATRPRPRPSRRRGPRRTRRHRPAPPARFPQSGSFGCSTRSSEHPRRRWRRQLALERSLEPHGRAEGPAEHHAIRPGVARRVAVGAVARALTCADVDPAAAAVRLHDPARPAADHGSPQHADAPEGLKEKERGDRRPAGAVGLRGRLLAADRGEVRPGVVQAEPRSSMAPSLGWSRPSRRPWRRQSAASYRAWSRGRPRRSP